MLPDLVFAEFQAGVSQQHAYMRLHDKCSYIACSTFLEDGACCLDPATQVPCPLPKDGGLLHARVHLEHFWGVNVQAMLHQLARAKALRSLVLMWVYAPNPVLATCNVLVRYQHKIQPLFS